MPKTRTFPLTPTRTHTYATLDTLTNNQTQKFSLQHSSRNRKRCWIRYPRAVKWLPRLAAPSRALRQHRCYPARRELVRSRNLPRYRSTVRPLPTLRPSVPTSVRCLALLRLALHWLVANTRSPPANIRSLTPFQRPKLQRKRPILTARRGRLDNELVAVDPSTIPTRRATWRCHRKGPWCGTIRRCHRVRRPNGRCGATA